MIDVTSKLVFSNASATDTKTLAVAQGEILTLQVDGTFTGLSLVIRGINNPTSDTSYSLMGYDLSTFTTVASIGANGLYQFSVVGLFQVQINISSISSGSVNVFARISKEG